jgi:hypothetical protein
MKHTFKNYIYMKRDLIPDSDIFFEAHMLVMHLRSSTTSDEFKNYI